MATNQRVPKKSTKKRTPRRRKPKVKLDNKSVLVLTAIIIVLCAVFLSISFIYSTPKKEKKAEQIAIEKPIQPPKSEKKSEPKVEKKTEKKFEQIPTEPKKEPKKETEPRKENKKVQVQEVPQKKVEEAPVQPKKESPKREPKKESAKIASIAPPSKKPLEELPAPAKYNIPPAKNGATLVFIIDDGGYSTANLKKYTSLPFAITIAVLPKLPHSKDCAALVRSSGQELMLHQPMQAQNLKINPGEGAILPDMSLSEIYTQVMQNLSEVGPVKGMNNHEGSLITCDVMKIGAVLDATIDSNIYFVDSRTSSQTQAPQAALERDISILHRDVFIDDIISREEMLKQIYRGLGIANKNGKVIMIGHVDKSAKILPDLLNDMYFELKQKGYKFAFPSQIR